MELSENAVTVLASRYLLRSENLEITETPRELFARVAGHIAGAEQSGTLAEKWEEKFFEMMISRDFLPNSPTLMNAGTALGQLSACFVVPVEDTMESIFEAVKQMALIQRSGGGTGFSFSRLRPKNDPVVSTGGKASGPVSFMKIFDCATQHIKQGGKRRGANMGVLRVDHPDILEFIRAKKDGQTLQNFNLSVAVTNSFMAAVKNNDAFALIHPVTKNVSAQISAHEIFQEIVNAAYATGDPGLLFVDRINQANPTPHIGSIEATNPCGEIPLLPYESCNLGSINLAHMLENSDPPGNARLNKPRLYDTVTRAVRFLDNVITMNHYPVDEIRTATRGNRKIGLGVMGFAEMLIRMGISYDSDKAVQTGADIMELINNEAYAASCELAEEKGVYPNWKGSVHEKNGIRIRNAARTAIAPTGTIGIIADTTASIEPLFALAYKRVNVLENQNFNEVNALFREYSQRHHLNTEEILQQVMKKGTLMEIENVPQQLKEIFKTALEIPPDRHLQIQAAFSRHVDNSVSKTINMPEKSTPADVGHAFYTAWELGLKGITIYRYGSKSHQVLELGADEKPYHYDHASKCDPEECHL